MDRFWLLCIGLAIMTYSLAHVYRIAALALQIVDQPNHRSAHYEVTPTGAGIAFVLTFAISLWLMNRAQSPQADVALLCSVLPALLLITVIGLIDDFKPLHWLVRAPIHFICSAWVIFKVGFPDLHLLGFTFESNILLLVFGAVSLVWLLNLYNFMDGIDGIATSEAVFVLLGATVVGWFVDADTSESVLALAAVCLGFLVINWPKARVFMGDGGSGFLGLILGSMALAEFLVPVWCWMILLGWFIADSGLTILIRLIRGEKVHEAHNLHAYQHLNRAVGTQRTLLIVQTVNIVWLLPLAYLAALAEEWGLLLLILALTPMLIYQFYCGAGQRSSRLMTER